MSTSTTVEKRSQREAHFHDDIAVKTDVTRIQVDKFFTSPTALENKGS